MNLLEALCDGEDEGREERVAAALSQSHVPETRRQIILQFLLPLMPGFKERGPECGTVYDRMMQFRAFLHEVVGEQKEIPLTVDALIQEIRGRVDASY